MFQSGLGLAVPAVGTSQTAIGAPFTNRVYGADWRLQGPRTSVDIQLLDTQQRYQFTSATDQNRDLKDLGMMVARQLGPVLNWDVGVHFERQDLTGERATNGTTAITDLRWRVGRRVSLRFIYAHTTFFGINDNQLGVLAAYTLLGGAGGAAPSQTPEFQPALSPYGLQPIAPMSTVPAPH
jgi:hypothetical protein